MKFFRRLEAAPSTLPSQHAAAAATASDGTTDWIPVDIGPWRSLFTAMAFFADHPGAPHHTTPGFPTIARTEGDPQ